VAITESSFAPSRDVLSLHCGAVLEPGCADRGDAPAGLVGEARGAKAHRTDALSTARGRSGASGS